MVSMTEEDLKKAMEQDQAAKDANRPVQKVLWSEAVAGMEKQFLIMAKKLSLDMLNVSAVCIDRSIPNGKDEGSSCVEKYIDVARKAASLAEFFDSLADKAYVRVSPISKTEVKDE